MSSSVNAGKTKAGHIGRASERIQSQARAKLVLSHCDDCPPIAVSLHDLSDSGVGMRSPLDVAVGVPVVVLLPLGGATPTSLRGRIASCHQLGEGDYRLGVQFEGTPVQVIERIREIFFSV